MKKIRIQALVLAVLMIAGMVLATGCGKSAKVVSEVTIKFQAPQGKYADMNATEISALLNSGEVKESDVYEELFLDTIKVEGTTTNPPTVLLAAEQALTKFEVDFDESADGTYLASVFGHTQADSVDSENGYYSYWECTINGDLSSSGRQSVTIAYDQDVIVYTWTSSSKPRQDTGAVESTDPNAETTGYIPTDDTTIAQDTEEVA